MRTEDFKHGVVPILLVFALVFSMISVVSLASPAWPDYASNATKVMTGPIISASPEWPDYIIIQGSDTCYTKDESGPPPRLIYELDNKPPIMAAKKIGSGAVIAAGIARTCNGDGYEWKWTFGELEILFDKAFQWMTGKAPSETMVLWYDGYEVWNNAVRCSGLIDNLKDMGYTVEDTATTPITSSLLDPYDILIIAQFELGDSSTGGDPDFLPDADVQAIKTWVEGGGGLFIMDGNDRTYNFHRVQNKILEALDFGVYFQHDTVYDTNPPYGDDKYITADVNLTEFGADYRDAAGKTTITLYRVNSLSVPGPGVVVDITPKYQSSTPGSTLAFSVSVTNKDAYEDSYVLTVSDSAGWGLTLSETYLADVDGLKSREVMLTVAIPPGASIGAEDKITVKAESVVKPEVSDDYSCIARAAMQIIPPIDDAQVVEGSPGTNYGGKAFMYTGSSTTGIYLDEQVFLKFDLRGIPTTIPPGDWVAADLHARLHVYSFTTSGALGKNVQVRSVDNDNWDEAEITWNDHPEYGGILDTHAVTEAGWYSWDVTSHVQNQFTGDKIASFSMTAESEDLGYPDNFSYGFNTKEADVKFWPYLKFILPYEVDVSIKPWIQDTSPGGTLAYTVIVRNVGSEIDSYSLSVTDTQGWGPVIAQTQSTNVQYGESWTTTLAVTIPSDAPPSTKDTITITATSQADSTVSDSENCIAHAFEGVKLLPTDDAHVSSGNEHINYGGEDTLYLQSDTGGFKNQRIFLKFDLSTIPSGSTITEAEVWLWSRKAEFADINAQCWSVTDDEWYEADPGGVTWGTQPAHVALLDTVPLKYLPPSEDMWLLWDVTEFVRNEFAGDKIVSFSIKAEVESASGRYRFNSKEWPRENERPYLKISYTPPTEWNAFIAATFPQGSDDAIFGVRPDATAGFDSAYDLPEPPPPVEPPYVQAFFHYPGNPSTLRRLHRSCIPPEDNMEWPLRVSFSNGTDNVTLSWSLENVPAGYAVLLYKGEILVADMRAVDNYTFEAAISEYDFTIRVAVAAVGVDVFISPSYQSGLPGATLSYIVTVTNAGNVPDNYALAASDDAGWVDNITLSENLLEVPPGENKTTTLTVTVPENAVPCTEDNVTVTATSQIDNAVSDSASCIAHAVVLVPTVVTRAATGVTTTQATLNADFTVGIYDSIDVWFQYRVQGEDAWIETTPATYTASGSHSDDATGLSPDTTYEFRTCLQYDTENIYSDVLTFTTEAVAPSAPALKSPADGTITNDNTPTFEWTVGSYADNHQLLIDNDPDFTSLIENRLFGRTDNTYTPVLENSLSDDNYSWKVIAINALGENQSSVWTFVIDTVPPAAPSLISPVDGTITDDSTPTFDWSDVTGAENYDLLVDDDADFSSPEIQVTVSVSTYTPTAELPDDSYSWKVRARDAANNVGDWSSTWTSLIKTIVRRVEVSISPENQSGAPGETLTYTVTIVNEGDAQDTYDLTVTEALGWSVTLSPTSLTLAAGASGTATLTVTIPSDAEDGDDDAITVTATSQADSTVSASDTCRATATVVMGVDVSISPESQGGPPGETLTYTVTVVNEGDAEDTYDLTVTDTWGATVSLTLLTIVAGGSDTATVSVTIPEGTAEGTEDEITVRAISRADPTVSDSATCIASAAAVMGVEVSISPDEQSGTPEETLTYTVTVKNTGNVEDTYDLEASDNADWDPAVSPSSLTIAAGASGTATVSVTIPWWDAGGAEDEITVRAISRADSTVSDIATCTAQATTLREVDVFISPENRSGVPGETLTYTVPVINLGNVADNYDLTVSDNENWGPTLSENSLENVQPDYDRIVTLSVAIPENAEPGTRDEITVTATSRENIEVSDSATCTAQATTLWEVKVSISPENQSGAPGETLTYTVTVINEGNVEDNYDLEASDNADPSWNLTVSPSWLTLAAGATGEATLRVMVPPDAVEGTSMTANVRASSWGNPMVIRRDTCRTIVTGMPVVPPGQPMLYLPADGATTNYNIPYFEWENGANADNHRLLVDNDPDFTSPIENRLFGSIDNTYTLENGLPDDNYSWKVIAINALGENQSPIWTFVIDTVPPGAPAWGSPPDGTITDDNAPTFNWENVPDAENYDFIIDGIQVTISVSTYTPTAGLPDGSYSWKVMARDAAGNVSDWSSTWTLIIKTKWDALITTTFPVGSDDAIFGVRQDATSGFDSAYDLPEPPLPVEPPYVQAFFHYPGNPSTLRRLHRSCIPPEDNMEWPLRISYRDGAENITLSWNLENVPGNHAVLLFKGENLVANMRAMDNYTFSAASGDHDFTVRVSKILVLTPPVLLMPPNETITNDNTPTFEWIVGFNADNHRLVIDNDPNFADGENIYDNANLGGTENSITIENELPPDNYYWKVAAINAQGENWSENTWTFEVFAVLPPGQPTLHSPANGVNTNGNTPYFEWTMGANADNHRLLVDNDANFLTPIENRVLGATENTYTPALENSLPDDNYSWKVIAINALGENQSSVWTFVIDTVPPAAPSLGSPADGAITNDNTPTFDWLDVTGAENYDLLVDDDSDFSSPENEVTVSVPTCTPTAELPNDNYSWKVRARDAANNIGEWSSTWTLLISIVRDVDVFISPSYQSGLPGATLSYTVTVKNEGNISDTFNLTATYSAGWGPTLSKDSLKLAPKAYDTVTLTVTIPTDASVGDQDNITITAKSTVDATVSKSARCTAQATAIRRRVDVSISPESKSGPPGEKLTYTVTVLNEGDVEDTYDLTVVDDLTWGATVSPTLLTIAAGSSDTTTMSVVIPDGTASGTDDEITVTATSRADLTVSDSATCIASAAAVGGVKVTISPETKSGPSEEMLTYTVTVKNEGNVGDTYILSTAGAPDWSPRVENTSLTLNAGEVGETTLTVTIPPGASEGASKTVTVTAISVGDPTVVGSVTCKATVKGVPERPEVLPIPLAISVFLIGAAILTPAYLLRARSKRAARRRVLRGPRRF